MLSLSPAAQSRLGALTNITVLFSEPVIGVSAGDLLVNGQPAQSVSGSLAGPYTFAFAQPELGTVQVDWAPAQAIRDLGAPANAFAGGSWVYTLEERRINHVVEVLVDGLGAAYLKRYLAQAPGVFSNFARLQAEGASTLNARCDYEHLGNPAQPRRCLHRPARSSARRLVQHHLPRAHHRFGQRQDHPRLHNGQPERPLQNRACLTWSMTTASPPHSSTPRRR